MLFYPSAPSNSTQWRPIKFQVPVIATCLDVLDMYETDVAAFLYFCDLRPCLRAALICAGALSPANVLQDAVIARIAFNRLLKVFHAGYCPESLSKQDRSRSDREVGTGVRPSWRCMRLTTTCFAHNVILLCMKATLTQTLGVTLGRTVVHNLERLSAHFVYHRTI